MSTRTSASLLAAAGCLALLPATADAATLTPTSGCHHVRAPMTVTGGGWPVGEVVNVSAAGISAQAAADPAGNVTFSVVAPQPFLPNDPHRKITTQTLNGNSIPRSLSEDSVQAAAQFDVTNRALSVTPSTRRPGRKVRWRPTGFAPGTPLFLHAVRGGKARRSVPIGAMPNRCATTPTATRLLPVTRPARGRWTLQVDASATYDAGSPGAVRTQVRVQR